MAFGVEIEDVEASSVIDLIGLNTDDNLRVDDDWSPVAYTEEGGFIVDTIPMLAVGTNAEVRNILRDLERILEKATLWRTDKSRADYIRMNYLEAAGGKEVYRTIVGGTIIPVTLTAHDKFLDKTTGRNLFRFDLRLEVVPGWESPELTKGTGALDKFGGQTTLTNNNGTRPARLGRVIATPTIDIYGSVWLGLRDKRQGLTDFTARALFDNFSLTNSVKIAGDSTSYGTNIVKTSSTNDMVRRAGHSWGALTNPEQINGKYLILCRCKTDATGVKWGLQVRWGFGNVLNENVEVEVGYNDDRWQVIPLGYTQYPPWPLAQNVKDDLTNQTLTFWAERIGTTPGDLLMDAIVFMPTDHLFTMRVDNSAGSANPFGLDIMTREDWHQFAYGVNLTSTNAIGNMAQSFQNWSMPVGDSEVVLVAESEIGGFFESPNPGDTLTFTFYPQPVSGFPFEV